MPEIRAVIFDFGGVFTTSPVANFIAYEEANGLPTKFLGGVIKKNHHTNAWAQFERGEMSRQDFDHAYAEETREAGHEVRGETLLSLLTLKTEPEMIDAFYKIKEAGFLTGCITNNFADMDSIAMVRDKSEAKQADDVFAKFDHVIESSKAGIRKPQPEIYQMMCDHFALPPSSCVFLDDLGINLKPARALGMHTIKVAVGDVKPAADELLELLKL